MTRTTEDGPGAEIRGVADFLRSLADAVGSTSDSAGAMQWAVDAVCAFTGWPLGHIFMVDRQTGRLLPNDVWHNDDEATFAPFVGATRASSFASGEGLPGRVLASAEPTWIADLQSDTSFPRLEAARKAGIVTAVGFPVRSAAGIPAVMEFFSGERVEPDRDLLNLVSHVGVQLGHLLDRSQADADLRSSEARLAEAERIGRAGSWSWVVGDDAVTWSAELFRIYGLDRLAGPVAYRTYLSRVHPEDSAQVAGAIDTVVRDLAPFEHDYRIVLDDGSVRWVHARIEVVAHRDGVAQRLAGYCQDVTERHRAEDQRRLAQLELESHQHTLERIARAEPIEGTLDGLCRDIESRYPGARCSVLLAEPVEGVLHHAAAPSLPRSFRAAIDGLPIAEGSGACGSAAARNEMVVVEDTLSDPLTTKFTEIARQHHLRAVWSHPLATRSGQVIGTFAVYRAVPHRPDESEIRTVTTAGSLASLALERRMIEDALTKAASIDPLTGLHNRTHFLQRLESQLVGSDAPVAVMFLDLDGFKWINDSIGHPAGDRILVEVAARLAAALGPDDHLARFGGDEFTILVTGKSACVADAADALTDRVHAALLEPFVVDGGEFFVSCCVGIALNDHPTDPYGLIREADSAMFSAKEAGHGRRAKFDHRMRARAVDRVVIEAELRRAIERDEFVMHYQPILDLTSEQCVGSEALVRWQHPDRGLVPPAVFIPLAEENGLIIPLGELVLGKVIAERSAWSDAYRSVYVAVNVSVAQFSDPNMGASVVDRVDRSGLDPALIVIELTETAVMQEMQHARQALEQLTDAGIRILIDDFGTGYSSISRLGHLPVSGLKIDNLFSSGLGVDPGAGRVVEAIADLAHALELSVVIEGIETADAKVAALALGCDYAQGYHLGRPAPAATWFPAR